MDRYPCDGHLNIIVTPLPNKQQSPRHTVLITLQHAIQHKTYEDVGMPTAALDFIHDHVFSPPLLITAEVRRLWPSVSSKQVYDTWSCLTEDLWKSDKDQLVSAKDLLRRLGDQVDTWDLDVPEGVVAIGWGMKVIAEKLRDQIVEVALDATCECIILWSMSLLMCLQSIQTKVNWNCTLLLGNMIIVASHLHIVLSQQLLLLLIVNA